MRQVRLIMRRTLYLLTRQSPKRIVGESSAHKLKGKLVLAKNYTLRDGAGDERAKEFLKYAVHKASMAGRYLRRRVRRFITTTWWLSCRFAGFRQRPAVAGGGTYKYLEKPYGSRRGIIAPWEATMVVVIAAWAVGSVEITLTAWEDILAPPFGVMWRSWLALPVLYVVARRQISQKRFQSNKRRELRQEEVRLHRQKLYLP